VPFVALSVPSGQVVDFQVFCPKKASVKFSPLCHRDSAKKRD